MNHLELVRKIVGLYVAYTRDLTIAIKMEQDYTKVYEWYEHLAKGEFDVLKNNPQKFLK